MPTATEHHQRSQARQSQSSTKDGLTSGVLPAKPWIVSRLRSMMPSRPLTFREAQVIAERQAATVLSTWGLDASDGFRVPEEVISEIPRIEVRYQTGMAQSGSSTWRAGAWRVAVSSEEWHCRQRFTLAHELKHILDSPHESQIYSDLPKATPAQRRARTRHIEALCDHFAACLLMPRMSIKRAWGNGLQNLAELAEAFDVSQVAMGIRLQNLGLVAKQPRRQVSLLGSVAIQATAEPATARPRRSRHRYRLPSIPTPSCRHLQPQSLPAASHGRVSSAKMDALHWDFAPVVQGGQTWQSI